MKRRPKLVAVLGTAMGIGHCVGESWFEVEKTDTTHHEGAVRARNIRTEHRHQLFCLSIFSSLFLFSAQTFLRIEKLILLNKHPQQFVLFFLKISEAKRFCFINELLTHEPRRHDSLMT